MSRFRSYFSKNNTLIENNRINNSQNPVTEISYGTLNTIVSRFIFDIDLNAITEKINSGELNSDLIQSHTLNLTNTIRFIPELVGKRYSDCETQRAASFTLELFNIDEDWDEGNGYDFVYVDEQFPNIPRQAVNWYEKKSGVVWNVAGAYKTGSTTGSTILGTLEFEDGSEDFRLDITDYINSRILVSGSTGFTATTFGLGIKFTDDIESLETKKRQAVAFHVKDSPTFYEPYVETILSDNIVDDRHYFYMDKTNSLYLYANAGGNAKNISISGVTILDYEGNVVDIITGSSVQEIKKGVYKLTYSVDSDEYPDQVIFNDVWSIVVDGKNKEISQDFYLINGDKYLNFDLSNRVDFDNYFFNIVGIGDTERIIAGDKRRIIIDVRELYPNQDNNLPLNLEYRIFLKQDVDHEIDVIPFTSVDRTIVGYEFVLDTSWLIPQDYFLEVKISNNEVFNTKKPVKFTVVSREII